MAKLYPSMIFGLITGPVRTEMADDGQTIVTHLQKFSRFGFLITWPFCFHFWLFWKKQEKHTFGFIDLGWEPGTEQGIYFRTPGFRWDADLGMKWTWGYFGLHWD